MALSPNDSTDALSTAPTAKPSLAPHHHHPHLHRIRSFLHPSGKTIHVAPSPSDADTLRKTLSSTEKDFDLVIHGSDEHIEALREAHGQQEQERDGLREEHGEMLDRYEKVIRQMDRLGEELAAVSGRAVLLDANFEKYGYSAHLRTRDSPNQSSANSLHDPLDAEKGDWDASRSQGQFMRFWKKPLIRQYFHKGFLWRSSEMTQVASYELFIDLLYVGIIDIAGEAAAEHATGLTLQRFAIVFILGWRFWADLGQLIQWFEADDIVRRLTVLFILTCLLGFTTNMNASEEHTYTSLIAFYLAERLFIALFYAWHGFIIPMVRGPMIANAVLIVLPAALWIASIHVHIPERYALIWVAIVMDLFLSGTLIWLSRWEGWTGRARDMIKRTFEFMPAVNIEHKIERTGAFVTLVFGYSVLSLLYQNSADFGVNGFFGKAVLGLIQAFSFNWIYFELDSFNLHIHAIRRSVWSSVAWMWAHLPFILGYVISSSALSKLVLAHDFPDADYDTLEGHYHERSEAEIESGQRWFYCGGLAIALMCMNIISLCHEYKTIPNQRLIKPKRIAVRFAVAIAILLLPLAENLNSLHLIATTMGLIVLVLILELLGSTCAGQGLFCRDRSDCTYSAKCNVTKKELLAKARKGEVIDVEELAKREQPAGEKNAVGY